MSPQPLDAAAATPANGSAGVQEVGRRPWSKDQLLKIEDLELALDAAARVNQHLNTEVEGLLQQLAKAQAERDAWQQHAQHLARRLVADRRQHAARSGAVGGDADADEAEARALAALPGVEAVVLQPGAFEWEGAHGAVGALVSKGQAAGWLARPAEIELADVLGQGAFGTTHRALWRGTHVAVKRVAVSSETELVNFLREVECLASVRHPNVVPFLGACLQNQDTCWLISEYMPGGTLAHWLHGSGSGMAPKQPLLQRLERALEVARALCALECCKPPVLHRDVKPSNVFLDAAGCARLGDFGLARQLPSSRATLTGETGTYLYMAPEMIRHELYDNKADVWSFGVMLAELVTAQIPYTHTYMTPVQIAMGVADEKLQPWLPSNLPPQVLALAHACCDYDPEMRPGFSGVVEELAAAVADIQAAQRVQAAGGGGGGSRLLGRLMGSSTIPGSWASVLGGLAPADGGGSDATGGNGGAARGR